MGLGAKYISMLDIKQRIKFRDGHKYLQENSLSMFTNTGFANDKSSFIDMF